MMTSCGSSAYEGAKIDHHERVDETSVWVQRLIAAAESGEPLDAAPQAGGRDGGLLLSLTEEEIADWGDERTIPASVLREALLALADRRVDPRGLTIRFARITGDVDLDHSTMAFPLRIHRSVFTGTLSARDSHLKELDLRGCRCTMITADGSRIAGRLVLQGATLTHPGGNALTLDRAQIDGGAFLYGLTATGEVRAASARITGQLMLEDATLTNLGGDALTLDRAQIDGGAFLRGLTATGEVHAPGAQIAGQLGLQGATLTNLGGDALTLDRAQIDGGAFLDGLTATGEVRAAGARITGQLVLEGATLTNPGGNALTLDGAQIDVLLLGPASGDRIDGGLSLVQARIDVLSAFGALPTPLNATGWRLGDVHGTIRQDWRASRAWLDSTTAGFSSQPWHELAAFFERAGQPTEARRLRFEAARRTTRHAPWYAKPARWAYGAAVGHGYYPLRAAGWLGVIFFLTLLVTTISPQAFGPVDLPSAVPASVLRSVPAGELPTGATSCSELKPGYPCFGPVQYAFGVAIPVVDTTQASAWQPIDAAASAVIGATRVLAWVFTALLLAGVTGLLRRT